MKWVFIVLASLIGIALITGYVLSESKPTGTSGPEADALAKKMLVAINIEAWDTTGLVLWTFRDANRYVWDRKRDFVKVSWDDHHVLLHTKSVTGIASKGSLELDKQSSDKLVQQAWSYFCNDSWWLNAPSKVFDPGTERYVVQLEDGQKGLMIQYTSGGVTPGDSYLWTLDDSGLPLSYKMWVKIIPIGGLEFTWSDWMELPTGAKLAQNHRQKFLSIPITNIEGYTDIKDWNKESDPFEELQTLIE